jgi:hypothetical protein
MASDTLSLTRVAASSLVTVWRHPAKSTLEAGRVSSKI